MGTFAEKQRIVQWPCIDRYRKDAGSDARTYAQGGILDDDGFVGRYTGFLQSYQVRLRIGFPALHVEGGHVLVGRKAVRIGAVELVDETPLAGACHHEALQAALPHFPQHVGRTRHRFAVVELLEQGRLLFVDLPALVVGGRPVEGVLIQDIDRTGTCPPLIEIEIALGGEEMMAVGHRFPSPRMEAHRVEQDAVHIEQDGFRAQPWCMGGNKIGRDSIVDG